MRILETKNLYQQEEIKRIKGINEGILNSNNGSQTASCVTSNCPTQKTDPRVIILGNENLATKLKLLEQSFEFQLSLIKIDMNNRFTSLQNNSTQNLNKTNFPKCRDSNKIKILSDKFDDLNA